MNFTGEIKNDIDLLYNFIKDTNKKSNYEYVFKINDANYVNNIYNNFCTRADDENVYIRKYNKKIIKIPYDSIPSYICSNLIQTTEGTISIYGKNWSILIEWYLDFVCISIKKQIMNQK